MMKKALYAVLGLVALFLVTAAFLPSAYSVERSIEIGRPPSVVFGQVADFNQWLAWSPWPEMEPAAKNTITGIPGTVGSTWAWEGKEIGVGSMTVEEVEKDRLLRSKLAFKEPMSSEADDSMRLEPIPSGTKVTWTNRGNLPYPVGRYFGLGVEGMLGPQFEKGLAKLKRVCESLPEVAAAPSAPEAREAGAGNP
jgi:hypothetical protein